MYLKHTLKTILRAPLAYIGFIILLTLSVVLFVLGFSVFVKGGRELERIKASYKVLGVLEEKEKSDFSFQPLPMEITQTIIDSDYVRSSNAQVTLAGTIEGFIRLPYQQSNNSLEGQLFFKGQVIDYEDIDTDSYSLSVRLDEVYYGHRDAGSTIKVELEKNLLADSNDLLSGSSYYFGITNAGSSIYFIDSNFLIPEAAVRGEGSEGTQYSTTYELYLSKIDELIQTEHRFPVYFTNDLDSIYNFYNKEAAINKGRTFTKEEYTENAKVCILNQELALKYNLEVGDSIDISSIDNNVIRLNKTMVPWRTAIVTGGDTDGEGPPVSESPYKDFLIKEPARYTIVGIYRSSIRDISKEYYIDRNTIYVPCLYTYDINTFAKYPNTFSFVLKDPDKKEEFLKAVFSSSELADAYKVTIFDKGFYLIQHILTAMKEGVLNLLVITILAIFALLFLFTYFYSHSKKREFAITRVMGEGKWKAAQVFFQGLLITGIFSVILGGIISYNLADIYIQRAYNMGTKSAVANGILEGEYSNSYVFQSELPLYSVLLPMGIVLTLLLLFALAGCLINMRKPLIQIISEKN